MRVAYKAMSDSLQGQRSETAAVTTTWLYISAVIGVAFASLALVFLVQAEPFNEHKSWVSHSSDDIHYIALGMSALLLFFMLYDETW